MITDKRTTLRPLLESSDGVHLTCYLLNRGDLIDLKRQLKDAMNEAYEFLHPVMPRDEQKRFLEPLDSLLHDARIFKKMKGNIGIFRTRDSFRVLNVPVDVEPACVIATSFHVKPLLKWIQSDRDFLLLGLEDRAAHLYLGNQQSFSRIDSVLYPEALRLDENSDDYASLKRKRTKGPKLRETISWLNDWICEVTGNARPKLFVAGRKELTDVFFAGLRYSNTVKTPVWPSFQESQVGEMTSVIRSHLKKEVSNKLEQALTEFRLAEDMNLTRKNIFQIAKAAIQGKVRKLIVADGIKIFGKIDAKSGGLSLHPYDLDHEDDDILDDLAQTVLNQGGEVIIATREEIPKGRPALAILDYKDSSERELEYVGLSEPTERRA